MNDPLRMSSLERFCDLHRNSQRLIGRNGTVLNPILQCRSVDEFHDERRRAVALLETIDLGDVWMIQRCKYLSLALKACQTFRVGRQRLRQDFDGNVAL